MAGAPEVKALILIPGIMGCDLMEPAQNTVEWLTIPEALEFFLLGSVSSAVPDPTHTLIGKDPILFAYSSMRNSMGTVPSGTTLPQYTVLSPTWPSNPPSGGYQVLGPSNYPAPPGGLGNRVYIEWAYDWRQSNATSAAALSAFLTNTVVPLNVTEINILAHSAGCLVTWELLRELSVAATANPEVTNLIKRVILIGAPLLGTPKAYSILRNGQGFLLPNWGILSYLGSASKSASALLPSAYELLPSQQYFDIAPRPVVRVAGAAPTDGTGNATALASYISSDNSPTFALGAPGSNVATLVANALNFHETLDAFTWPAGDGKQLLFVLNGEGSTIDGVDWNANCTSHDLNLTDQGDGTVTNVWSNWVKTATKTFPPFQASHLGLVKSSEVWKTIRDIVEGTYDEPEDPQ